MTEQDAKKFLDRLQRAMNEHDLDRLASMFDPDYRSIQPVHPERSFRGRDRVRENWAWVFERFDDFHATVLDFAVHDCTIWTEWLWAGSEPNGDNVEVRGIMIFEVKNELICAGRLYLEPLDS
jgi:ketosteroid isomerase-like protein